MKNIFSIFIPVVLIVLMFLSLLFVKAGFEDMSQKWQIVSQKAEMQMQLNSKLVNNEIYTANDILYVRNKDNYKFYEVKTESTNHVFYVPHYDILDVISALSEPAISYEEYDERLSIINSFYIKDSSGMLKL